MALKKVVLGTLVVVAAAAVGGLKAPNLARMGPVTEFVTGVLEKGAPEPGADWWPYMPIKRHIDTLFPAPGDVRDMAFWTARTLQRAHKG